MLVGMEKMVEGLIRDLRTSPAGMRTLLLARTTSEMIAAAKHADRVLRQAPYFSRSAYEGGVGYIFQLSFTVQEGEEPADLWVANIGEATPSTLTYFTDGHNASDWVCWPDEQGVFMVVPYDAWKEPWRPFTDSDWLGEERPSGPLPVFRPADIVSDDRFEVGLPGGWSPPGRKVSVWEHLRRNVSIEIGEVREEVNEMAKKKATKAKAKVKSPKKANKKSAAKKPA